jgi:hypothetical protein
VRAWLIVLVLAGAARADTDAELAAMPRQACDKARAHCFGLEIHIAGTSRGLVVTPEWLGKQEAAANRHFAALDVGFEVVAIDALPASNVHIETRGDRDGLATDRLGGKLIQVFIVGQLDDVDQENAIAYGVTWHTRKDDRKYIIVSNLALERTLAHELGHFFGLPHSTYAISIMNKSDRKEPPAEQRTFADEEVAAMRPVLKRLVRDKVIAERPR